MNAALKTISPDNVNLQFALANLETMKHATGGLPVRKTKLGERRRSHLPDFLSKLEKHSLPTQPGNSVFSVTHFDRMA